MKKNVLYAAAVLVVIVAVAIAPGGAEMLARHALACAQTDMGHLRLENNTDDAAEGGTIYMLSRPYSALRDAAERAGGADACCYALVYGGEMTEGGFAAARARVNSDINMQRGAFGDVYGWFCARDAAQCARMEGELRAALGEHARVDRWVVALGASSVQERVPQDMRIPLRAAEPTEELSAAVMRLLSAVGDDVGSAYSQGRCASANGARYQAAARAGDDGIWYMLAEGYLPIDY